MEESKEQSPQAPQSTCETENKTEFLKNFSERLKNLGTRRSIGKKKLELIEDATENDKKEEAKSFIESDQKLLNDNFPNENEPTLGSNLVLNNGCNNLNSPLLMPNTMNLSNCNMNEYMPLCLGGKNIVNLSCYNFQGFNNFMLPNPPLNLPNLNPMQNFPNKLFSKLQKSLKKTDRRENLQVFKNYKAVLLHLQTYKGSMALQNLLSHFSEAEIQEILNDISSYIIDIMCSHYGNYFIQKLLLRLNLQQKLFIYRLISNRFLDIALNSSGTYVIQCLIDMIKSPLEEKILENLINPNILYLMCDENGHHIIIKIIIDFAEFRRQYINDFIVENVEQISKNYYGSYCINKFINSNKDQNIKENLLNKIKNSALNMALNKNSCATLKLVLEKYGLPSCAFIVETVKNNLCLLATNQSSLFFMSKIFLYLSKSCSSELSEIIWEIYQNDLIVQNFLSSENGIKILNFVRGFSNPKQKMFFKNKYKNNLQC